MNFNSNFLAFLISFPQRFDRSSPGSYSPYSLNYQGSDSSFGFPSNQSYSPQLHSHHLHAFGHHNASSSPAHQQQQQQSSPHFGNHIQKRTSIRSGSSQNSNESTKRNHRHNNQGYELSQDLIDKQIELLERKYGGRVKAQHAALVRYYLILQNFIQFITFLLSIVLGYSTCISSIHVKQKVCIN